jgi:hypothetical protein
MDVSSPRASSPKNMYDPLPNISGSDGISMEMEF